MSFKQIFFNLNTFQIHGYPSPSYDGDRDFYVGVSSLEVELPPEQCCTFRGSLAKLDIGTGDVTWRTYMIPDNGGRPGGYSGAALWGSSPALDAKRGLLYIATGNLYSAPSAVLECQARRNNRTAPSRPEQCIDDPNVHFDSILALELVSGNIRWFRRFEEYDVSTFACLEPNNPACPPGPNLEADFGEAPMMLTIFPNGTVRDIVVAVQKSGYAWALDRDSGDIVWFNVSIKTKPYILIQYLNQGWQYGGSVTPSQLRDLYLRTNSHPRPT